MPLSPGQVLNNRYRIAKLIGQGGFGAVYRAWDIVINQPYAVKENLDTSPEAQRQFQREADLLAGLSHPHLPRVLTHLIIPNQGQYLVMDFIEGHSLEQLLERHGGPLSEALVLPWIEQVCSALDYLHGLTPPIIHRDIKPQNIIITPVGQAILVDFGISKVYDEQLRTTVGARAVTPGFSPPEQYGQGKTDARSDIYSLGATLYTLVTGQTPPEAVDMLTHNTPLTPPRQLNRQLSPQLEQAILSAMALQPDRRYSTIAAFRAALPTLQPVAKASTQPLKPGFQPWQQTFIGVSLLIILLIYGTAAQLYLTITTTPTATPIIHGRTVIIQTYPPTWTPTATRTPDPTKTPTITRTPTPTKMSNSPPTGKPRLELPTAVPTLISSPTSTQVTSPTPIK